jgi:COMPASS component SPP1
MDSSYNDSRFEIADASIKSESAAASPRASTTEPPPSSYKSSTPIPSTETPDTAPLSSSAPKKKGTASVVKKKPKRPAPGQLKKAKPPKSEDASNTADGSADEESDNGPYCLCRGPDDHRWMICCENCDDWFHGECINLDEEIGEGLIEKFVCPRCTNKYVTSIYKKSCGLPSCRKAARLGQSPPSVFCSNEHAQTWWNRMVSRLPKKGKAGLTDQLSQDEFMALLSGGLATVEGDGTWKMTDAPFSSGAVNGTSTNTNLEI